MIRAAFPRAPFLGFALSALAQPEQPQRNRNSWGIGCSQGIEENGLFAKTTGATALSPIFVWRRKCVGEKVGTGEILRLLRLSGCHVARNPLKSHMTFGHRIERLRLRHGLRRSGRAPARGAALRFFSALATWVIRARVRSTEMLFADTAQNCCGC